MGRRPERVGHLIREIVAEAIQTRLNDPRIEPLTSITRVNVSADLSLARINVSVLGTPARQELTLNALRGAASRLRAIVRERITARHIPQLEFYLDDSIKRGIETVNQLDELLPPPLDEDDEEALDDAAARDELADDAAADAANRPAARADDAAPRTGADAREDG